MMRPRPGQIQYTGLIVVLCVGVAIGLCWGRWWTTAPSTQHSGSLRLQLSSAAPLPSIAAFNKPVAGPNSYEGKAFSQIGQDKLVDQILNGMRGGFFVDSGAYDGVDLSNTLFFEVNRGWNGLLVEANPHLYQKIINKSTRNASVIHACVSPEKEPTVLPFRLAGPLGGLVGHYSNNMISRIKTDISAQQPWMAGQAGSGTDIKVSCWPLASMLKVLGVSRVDYWSLDTEGSEAAILRATDFDAIDVRVLTIEVNDAAAEAAVKEAMSRWPMYELHSKKEWDLVYVKRANH